MIPPGDPWQLHSQSVWVLWWCHCHQSGVSAALAARLERATGRILLGANCSKQVPHSTLTCLSCAKHIHCQRLALAANVGSGCARTYRPSCCSRFNLNIVILMRLVPSNCASAHSRMLCTETCGVLILWKSIPSRVHLVSQTNGLSLTNPCLPWPLLSQLVGLFDV